MSCTLDLMKNNKLLLQKFVFHVGWFVSSEEICNVHRGHLNFCLEHQECIETLE